MRLFTDAAGKPLFSSRRVLLNFIVLVLCSQFAFAVLAMKGALLPQMLELWQISKTQFGLLMSVYGIVHNILYLALAWVQDRFSPRILIPANMVLGGVTTFFLGTTSDFATLVFLFVMLAVWCEGAFWPAILSAVRRSTSDGNQGKIFGLLEGGRGTVELLQNLITVGLYAFLSYSVLGLKLAFMLNAVVMIGLGVVAWYTLPEETLLKSGNNSQGANREVLAGMKMTLRLPEVWLAGLVGFSIYVAYTAMPFFLTYLQDLHALPLIAISIFGIASTSTGRIAVALPAGFIAERFFGSAVGGMRMGLAMVVLLGCAMALLPAQSAFAWPAMLLMMALGFLFFFLRALYFAPFGEMGLPQRFSGAVIAVAAFVIYLPSSFAYLLWGWLLDNYPGHQGYIYLFATLAAVALAGVGIAHVLKRRMHSGLNQRIQDQVSALDHRLGLQGTEKTLSELIDNPGAGANKAAS